MKKCAAALKKCQDTIPAQSVTKHPCK